MNSVVVLHWGELNSKARASAIIAALFGIIVLIFYVFASVDLASQLSHASAMLGEAQMEALLNQPLVAEGFRVYHVARQQRLSESLAFFAFSFAIVANARTAISSAVALLSLAVALYFFLRSNDLLQQTMMNTELGLSGVHPTPPGLTVVIIALLIFLGWSRLNVIKSFNGIGNLTISEKQDLTIPSVLIILAILVPLF
jgi:hypothetical protein